MWPYLETMAIVDVRMGSDWSRGPPYSSVPEILRKRGHLVTEKYRKKTAWTYRGHTSWRWRQRPGMMLLQANDFQGWPANHQKEGVRHGRDLSRGPQKEPTLLMPDFQQLASKTDTQTDKKRTMFKPLSLGYIVMAAPANMLPLAAKRFLV